jgi:type I restriction enzyme, S subunit
VKEEELPGSWSLVSLDDVAEVGARTDVPAIDDDELVSFVPMAAVAEETGVLQLETRSYGNVAKGYTRFLEGDVLFAKITPCMENGKIAVARNLADGIGSGAQNLSLFVPKLTLIQITFDYFWRSGNFGRPPNGS